MKTLHGGCLCCAVRYETKADPVNQRVCHCKECQKAIGATFNARILMRIEDVAITGPVTHFTHQKLLSDAFVRVVVQQSFRDVLLLVSSV